MAEGQVLGDAIGVGFGRFGSFAQEATSFGAFALEEVTLAGMGPHDLAGPGNLETLGHSLSRLDAFWSSHMSKKTIKKSTNYRDRPVMKQAVNCGIFRNSDILSLRRWHLFVRLTILDRAAEANGFKLVSVCSLEAEKAIEFTLPCS
jgi:hypothetical protein